MARLNPRYWLPLAALCVVTGLQGCGGDASLEVVEALTPTPAPAGALAAPVPTATADPAR